MSPCSVFVEEGIRNFVACCNEETAGLISDINLNIYEVSLDVKC